MKLLSIIKKTNTNKPYIFDNTDSLKHFPSSTRYWDSSIFMYNNNALSLIPNISKLAIKFIRNYFYLYNNKIESKIRRKKIYNRRRKLSINRIFLSKGEFKHTNNKVIITLYIYNKQKNNYLLKLKKRYINKYLRNILSFKKNSVIEALSSKKNILSNKLILLKKLKKISINGNLALIQANLFKPQVARILKQLHEERKVNKFRVVSKYVNKFYKKLVKKSLKRLFIYTYYRRLIYVNKSRFNYTYLQYIKDKLQVLFNKNIEFNFINLKYFYLNSNILSESILLKIRKNRRKLMRHLSNLEKKVIIRKKRVLLGELVKKENLNTKKYFYNNKLLYKDIINKLKYKHINGFRLEAKGRLNKRYTASRSINKLKYKGNLLNIDSSYKGLSSVLLRNNLNSNLQYTKLNSKTRIGSFGLKGWVSGN
jgi:Mitochondrial ribosomal protein (VAR1)